MTPRGKPLGGFHNDTYWCWRLTEDNSADLAEALAANISYLEMNIAFLKEFAATGGSCEYDVAWFMTESSSETTLPWELVKRIADLNIDLGFDVYGRR